MSTARHMEANPAVEANSPDLVAARPPDLAAARPPDLAAARPPDLAAARTLEAGAPAARAYHILKFGFTVAPILAGADKFFNVLTDWTKYLPDFMAGLAGGNAHALMMAVGVIEVLAGIGVALKPRLFSYVVAAWLSVIIVNLLLVGGYLDVALRDLGLLLGALALGQLSADRAARKG